MSQYTIGLSCEVYFPQNFRNMGSTQVLTQVFSPNCPQPRSNHLAGEHRTDRDCPLSFITACRYLSTFAVHPQ
eukprot:scaffold11698_cov138-Cylindrotheca_fusiformis.AAC.10